ncbi:MAG: methyltransferase domain-containing protein [Solirubrobacterales bacterium]|nr:methyltransferase domain-containing protein [Solirubrobacterales bacterium]
MPQSANAPTRVRRHFRDNARAFDDLYEDERPLTRLLRPGLFRRRELAVRTVAARDSPRVLDVGCGSGRIGEHVVEAGAGRYLGIDFSEPMIELARDRLERFGSRVLLLTADFLTAELTGPYDVVIALGLFDYLPQPHLFTRRMFALCADGGCVVASFPRFSLVKGPTRQIRYEWLADCPIFNYSRRELEMLLGASGFGPLEITTRSSGHLVRAHRSQTQPDAG